MDYKALIKRLRHTICSGCMAGAMRDAATAIETLLAERDAAVNLLRGACYACINKETHYCKEPCSLCKWGGMRHTVPIAKLQDSWKWLGSQE